MKIQNKKKEALGRKCLKNSIVISRKIYILCGLLITIFITGCTEENIFIINRMNQTTNTISDVCGDNGAFCVVATGQKSMNFTNQGLNSYNWSVEV